MINGGLWRLNSALSPNERELTPLRADARNLFPGTASTILERRETKSEKAGRGNGTEMMACPGDETGTFMFQRCR
jgi:hypothetical protein